ncbi:type I polyketide synthase [Streptomyces sp. NPDC055254]
MSDIAITGLGCRFPGAPDIRAYWKLLLSGQRQFSPVPAERRHHETLPEPGGPSAPRASYTDRVAFLPDVDRFDARHYGVPPARARAMDPQHRLMLDVAREALDDAGLGRGDFDRENTGVFVGMSLSGHKDLMRAAVRAVAPADGSRAADGSEGPGAAEDPAEPFAAPPAFALTGSLLDTAAGTVSRQFDLGGPSFAVDAACSGSLVALDQAIAHLRQGSCTIAVVGGVYVDLTPDTLVGFARIRALSAAGVCRPFDEEADGFVLGEGAGAVVVRPLADALAEGDRVYAVIRGIGTAHDGASPGPLAPTAEGQVRAMRRAYDDAGLAPSSVGFLEAHGTGTAVGDRAEVEALRRLRTEHPDEDPGLCYLASGKALIGHSLSAAGIAGLIKTALVVHHRTIVPQPDTTPHPDLGVSAAGLRFADTVRPWPGGGAPRRAAVSSFGFGGTHVHVVLEERPAPAAGRFPVRTESAGPQLVLLSAGSRELLDRHIGEVLDALDHAPRVPLAALAHTLGGREPLTSRLAIVARDTDEFTQRLRHAHRQLGDCAGRELGDGPGGDLGDGAFAADAPLPPAQRRIAFLFPGQGSRLPGTMRDLHERFPGFRAAVAALAAVARQDTGVDLADLLYGESATARGDAREEIGRRLAATDLCQPLLGIVQLAATRLLAECGVTPDLALGHSVGEFAAASAAGALTGEDTIQLLVRRGAALRQAENGLRGGMLAVQSDKETCRRLSNGIDDVWLACFNQPHQVVVSGTPHGLAAMRRACADAGIVTVALDVSGAFHSPRLASAEEAVRADLAAHPVSSPVLPFVSTVNAEVCTDAARLRELWARHASTPVHFADAVAVAYGQGARVFLQVTGGGSLLSSVRRSLAGRVDLHLVPVTGPAPDNGRGLVLALARLAVLGAPVDPRALVPEEDRRLLDLPVAKLDTRSYRVPGGRPVPKAPAAPSSLCVPPPPTRPEETSMRNPTNGAASDPMNGAASDPMNDLLRLIQQQVALMTRLTEALHGEPAVPPAAPAAPVAPAGTAVSSAPVEPPPPEVATGERAPSSPARTRPTRSGTP